MTPGCQDCGRTNPPCGFYPMAFIGNAEKGGLLCNDCDKKRRDSSAEPKRTPYHAHVKDMVTAFAVGILEADPYFVAYEPPPHFGIAVRIFTKMVLRRWQVEDGLIPFFDIRELTIFFSFACGTDNWQPTAMDENHRKLLDIMKLWNTAPDGATVRCVSAIDPVPKRRDFIDIEALTRNASIFLRKRVEQTEKAVLS
jgi:hypothetical protein